MKLNIGFIGNFTNDYNTSLFFIQFLCKPTITQFDWYCMAYNCLKPTFHLEFFHLRN